MIKAIIADDEENAVGQMESMLSDLWPDLVVCGRATSGPEALELIETHKPQLAFMEVRLPGICGMQVARKISGSCQVVFTTSYDHYAVNAFDGGALDYLLKPVGRDRLQKAVQRAWKRICVSHKAQHPDLPPPAQPQAGSSSTHMPEYLHWICSQNGIRSRLIPVERVCYFKSDHKYTSVITRETETLINKSIKSLTGELDPRLFWRIHRSTIINVSKIAEVSRSRTGRGTVRLQDRPEVLLISRPYLHLFKKM